MKKVRLKRIKALPDWLSLELSCHRFAAEDYVFKSGERIITMTGDLIEPESITGYRIEMGHLMSSVEASNPRAANWLQTYAPERFRTARHVIVEAAKCEVFA